MAVFFFFFFSTHIFCIFWWVFVGLPKTRPIIEGSFRDFHVYFWWIMTIYKTCIFVRHPDSKSLVCYPEALCTEAWTQMNLAVFNEDVFTAVGHNDLTDIWLAVAHSLDRSRPKFGLIELFYIIKAYVNCTVDSVKIQPVLLIVGAHPLV